MTGGSEPDLFLELCNLLGGKHDLLLHECLLLLELSELSLHVLVFILLGRDLCLEVLEISDNQGVNHLYVLIVEGLQVVVHHGDILAQGLDLLLVLSQHVG